MSTEIIAASKVQGLRQATSRSFCLLQECHQQLASVMELVSLQAGVHRDSQILVVSETRRRYRGVRAAARDVAHSWAARKSTRSLVLGMMNYVFLPELVSR